MKQLGKNDMKPFDLEKALAGEEVVTRDGRTVKILYNLINNVKPIVGVILSENGYEEVRTWRVNGLASLFDSEHKYDLFMAPKIIEGYQIQAKITEYTCLGDYDGNKKVIFTYDKILQKDKPSMVNFLKANGYEVSVSLITWEE